MSTDQERITRLESNDEHVRTTLDEVRQDVKEIKATISRQKGFIAGVLFVLTPLWAAILLFAKSTWERWTG